jgi:DNA replication protein
VDRKAFAGFSVDRASLIGLPEEFFSRLLPEVMDLQELKVTLLVFWFASRKTGFPKGVFLRELMVDQTVMRAMKLTSGPTTAEDYLRAGLEKSVARAALLRVQAGDPGGADDFYMINTRPNRNVSARLERGDLQIEEVSLKPNREAKGSETAAEAPSIFSLYEDNIGILTPLLVDQLKEAELSYPSVWIVDAFKEAVSNNRRSWRYIQRVLENWSVRGREGAINRRGAEGAVDPDKRTWADYSHLFEH